MQNYPLIPKIRTLCVTGRTADRDYPLVPKVEVQGFQKGRLKILNIILYFKIFFCISIQIIIFALTDKADMRIIARNKIIEYYTRHPDAETALEDWYQKVKKAEWTCFADMKQIFGSVDSVGNQHYVFNIRGNNHRLIVVVKFTIKLVLVRFIGTHAEYDLIDAKNI